MISLYITFRIIAFNSYCVSLHCSVLDEPTYDDLESSNVSMCSGSVNEILDQVRQHLLLHFGLLFYEDQEN